MYMYVYVPRFLSQILNQDVDVLGIDDLGTEPSEVSDYGNVYTPVIDLLTKRYEEQLFTIITTNLTPQRTPT